MGRAPVVPWSLVIGNWEDMGKLARGLEVPERLTFVTIFFPVSWFLVIIAEIRLPVLFRGFHVMELNTENFSGLL